MDRYKLISYTETADRPEPTLKGGLIFFSTGWAIFENEETGATQALRVYFNNDDWTYWIDTPEGALEISKVIDDLEECSECGHLKDKEVYYGNK
jgi:hypothetical protein